MRRADERRRGGIALARRPKGRRAPWAAVFGGAAAVLILVGLGWHVLADRRTATMAPSIGNFIRVSRPVVSGGKPVQVFFLSALYCPYCGAERWALADALGRFGSWSNLVPAHSTAGVDGFAVVPTYDFVHAHYQSPFVDFTARDVADAQGNPLEPLSSAEKSLVNRFDPGGGIPFLFIAGAFAQQGSGYSPGLLVNRSFDQTRADLQGQTPDGQAIHHEADVLTALICYADGSRPQATCDTPAVRSLVAGVQ